MINYTLALQIINGIAYGLFGLMLIMSWYYIASFFISGKKVKPVPHSNKKTKFAIVVPARNESKVITNTFASFATQTYDRNYYDVWVIVESEDDPTCRIAKNFGYNVFVRKDLDNKHTKGFAIQELHNYFMENDINYVRRAVQLGNSPELIGAYHSGLRANLLKSPLMDVKNYMRELESGYCAIWQNFCTI